MHEMIHERTSAEFRDRYYYCVTAIQSDASTFSTGMEASMVATSSSKDIRNLVETGARLNSRQVGDRWVVEVRRLDHGDWKVRGYIQERNRG